MSPHMEPPYSHYLHLSSSSLKLAREGEDVWGECPGRCFGVTGGSPRGSLGNWSRPPVPAWLHPLFHPSALRYLLPSVRPSPASPAFFLLAATLHLRPPTGTRGDVAASQPGCLHHPLALTFLSHLTSPKEVSSL